MENTEIVTVTLVKNNSFEGDYAPGIVVTKWDKICLDVWPLCIVFILKTLNSQR